uniref:Uncharacterized protein n=1 Tax=Pavo cristatus TaxID=9049 RepID=A0A8C9FUJ3_PAVCR
FAYISRVPLYLSLGGSCSLEAYLLSLQSSFVGAIAIGDLVKSTLGPKGMAKCKIL